MNKIKLKLNLKLSKLRVGRNDNIKTLNIFIDFSQCKINRGMNISHCRLTNTTDTILNINLNQQYDVPDGTVCYQQGMRKYICIRGLWKLQGMLINDKYNTTCFILNIN